MISPPLSIYRSPQKTYENWREGLPKVGSNGVFPALSQLELCNLELFPGSPLGGTLYVVPESMVAAGPSSLPCNRTVDLMKGVPPSVRCDPEKLERILHVLRVTVVAALLVPRNSRRRRGCLPKPGTWTRFCQLFLHFSNWVLTYRPTSSTVFEHLTFKDFADGVNATSNSVGWVVREISKLKALNAVVDWPDVPVDLASVYKLVGMPELVKSHDDGSAFESEDREEGENQEFIVKNAHSTSQVESYKPLPDRFVTEAGWRVIWFIEDMGPNIIHLYDRLRDKPPGMEVGKKNKRSAKILDEYVWRDSHGVPITNLPVRLILSKKRGIKKFVALDTRDISRESQITDLAYLLQLCHIYAVSFCMGSRISELFSLTRECLEEVDARGDNGSRVTGRTYKLVAIAAGKERDWPIHHIGAEAIRQQNQLVAGMRQPGVDALWVQFRPAATGRVKTLQGGALKGLALNRIVEMLDLLEYIDERGLHHHRFRKTLARLGALALIGSPKILMDLFGHNSIKMTLFDYILSDSAIAAEIDQVARDMILMNSKEVLDTSDDHGGRAGARLRGFNWGTARRGEKELRAADIDEAAKILTLNGTSWTMVRPNVLCTKGPQQSGPCTRAVGYPEPSRCQPNCDHRLELNAARSDVQQSIAVSSGKLAEIQDWEGDHRALFWIGQLRHHLLRFEDIAALWAEDPIVLRLRNWEIANNLG